MFLINPYILQASGNPLWNDLLAYYTADNTPNDALGTYNGTLVNGATYGTGIINQGFSLDGINDYIDLGNVLDFDGTTPFSFSCWINADVVIGIQNIVTKSLNVSPFNGYQFRINNNTVEFALLNNATTNYLYVSSVTTITALSWYHLTVTYDGSRDVSGVKIYINNVSSTLNNLGNTLSSSISNTAKLTISSRNGTGQYFNGIIDEVGIWNRELTSSEVTELYNSGAGKQYPN